MVDPDLDVPPYLMVKTFPGAKCGVTRIEKLAEIGAAWEYLYEWVEDSKEYEHTHLDGLEEFVSPIGTPEEELAFNLYLPIR